MEWKTIDSAPKDKQVLVATSTGITVGIFRTKQPTGGQSKLYMWKIALLNGYQPWLAIPPSHWMPLPEPPK